MAEPISQIIASEEFTELLVTLVIPFVLFFTVLTIGFRMTKIFGSGNFIYILLGLGITVLIYVYNPGNIFNFLAGYLFKIGISTSIIIFLGAVALFSLSILNKLFRFLGDVGKSPQQKIQSLNKDAEKLLKEFYKTNSVEKRMVISGRLKDIESQIKYLKIKHEKIAYT